MTASGGARLPSEADADTGGGEPALAAAPPAPAEPETPAPAPTPAPRPGFKFSTMIIVFLGLLGFLMLIDQAYRNSIACSLGTWTVSPLSPQCPTGWGPLYYVIGFESQHLLATMACAGAIEMAITALAYNYTTDWVKAARVAKWGSAFRKVQMEALRSGKKDRIAALKPFQERINRLSSEVTIAQFKGMAITYFLLILIYTWIGLVIAAAPNQIVSLGGTVININNFHVFGYFPLWFFIFSLYTVPASMVFRRVLKTWWLRRYAEEHHILPVAPAVARAAGSPK